MLVIGGADLKQRTLSALVLVPVVLGVTYAGGPAFTIFWALAGFAVLYEWVTVARLAPRAAFLAACGLALAGALVALHVLGTGMALLILVCGLVACIAVVRPAGWAAGGFGVALAMVLPVVLVRGAGPLGFAAVLYLYAVVWATDIFAYFVGRAVGGPKLWPRLSPNKTWSGAVGGTLAGTAAGVAVAVAAGLPAAPALIALTAVASIAGQLGDLAESAFKRKFGVKDASRLIPGHGGIMDRLDGFAAAAVVVVLVALLRNPLDAAAGVLAW